MSRHATAFVLGYHGCDEAMGRRALSDEVALERSDRDYDSLGPGVYFWESDPLRAMEWATWKATKGEISVPFVIGAVIDLGNCLDLLLRDNIQLLSIAFDSFSALRQAGGLDIPENRDPASIGAGDKLLRFRYCAVIRHLHTMVETDGFFRQGGIVVEPFDTVRGLFVEGAPAYPGGGFYEKTHTQIAVRTDRCIKGLFLPRHLG